MAGGASAVWVAPSGGLGACGLPFSDNRGVVGVAGFQPRACNDNSGAGGGVRPISNGLTEPRFANIEAWGAISLGADGLGPALTSKPRGIRTGDEAEEAGFGDCLDNPGDCTPPDDGEEPTTILDLVELWREIARPRAKRSYLRMVTCAKLLNEVVGPLPPQSISRSHIMRLRDHLETTDLSRATARLYLQGIHRLFAVALSEGRTSENPARGIQLRAGTDKFVDRDRRRPFDHAELRAIAGALQSEPLAFRWLVRLLAYHGMRSGEAVQLHAEDVVPLFGVPVLRVHDRHGSIKNRFSQRDIPLHPACHGFLDYAHSQGGGRIFPVETWRADRFQRFAGVFLRKRAKIEDVTVTMHSLRHTWRTLAREIGMPAPVSRAIMGHAMGNDIHEGYGAGPSLRLQAEWIGRIDPFSAPHDD